MTTPTQSSSAPEPARPTIIFFHGLNTFGDDLLHLGPVTLGRMDQRLKLAMERRGLRFISVDGIGRGSPESQADIAMAQMNPDTIGPEVLHLLGQSMGGLVARVVARRLKEKNSRLNLKVWTLGTPHRGSVAADFALEFSKNNKRLARFLTAVGYRVGQNSETFRHYTPKSMDDFNLRYPIHSAAKEHSFICTIPVAAVSPYFLGLHGLIHGHGPLQTFQDLLMARDNYRPSDGFIPLGSQSWGEPHGPYELDHFAQMGFISKLGGRERRLRASAEFERLCDDFRDLVRL